MIDHATEILLTRYLDGDLEPEALRRLMERIETEPELVEALETMEHLRASVRRLALEEEPPDQLDALMGPLRRGGRPWTQRWTAVALTSAAAAVIVGLIVVSEVGRTGLRPWSGESRPSKGDHFVLSNLPERDDDAPMGPLERLMAAPFPEPDLPELELDFALGPLEAPPGAERPGRILEIGRVVIPLPDSPAVDPGDWIVEIVGGRVVACRDPDGSGDSPEVPSPCAGLVGVEPVPVDDGLHRASVVDWAGRLNSDR